MMDYLQALLLRQSRQDNPGHRRKIDVRTTVLGQSQLQKSVTTTDTIDIPPPDRDFVRLWLGLTVVYPITAGAPEPTIELRRYDDSEQVWHVMHRYVTVEGDATMYNGLVLLVGEGQHTIQLTTASPWPQTPHAPFLHHFKDKYKIGIEGSAGTVLYSVTQLYIDIPL